ncbi:MAG: thymidine phosphorylase, partial [Myxococcales bacterium]|nr:thymidine phosphorylase [Myxococcales bacterium]
AMAIFFRGLGPEETAALTLAMRDSGTVVNMRGVRGPKVDKHSTGGVGDKVSICLAPIVAACGVKVPMVSGRGLGHSGGTLDKLEAIPGFTVTQTVPQFVAQVRKLGCSLIGQTKDIAPADKRLYALRDVTATVESIPLITASILSKKLAEGIDALVLDVKVGNGAFMKTREDAEALARSIVRVGTLAKKRVSALLTSMDEPLGLTIGNALETREALEVLHGGGPEDLVEVTLLLGAEMLRLAKLAKGDGDARRQMKRAIDSGAALRTMKAIVTAQHGDPRVVDDPSRLREARHRVALPSPRAGYVRAMDAKALGLAAVAIGAGRMRTEDVIDPSVGFVLRKKVGDAVKKGEPLVDVHAASKTDAERIRARVFGAIEIGAKRVAPSPLLIKAIRAR